MKVIHLMTTPVTRRQHALFDPNHERQHRDDIKYSPEEDCRGADTGAYKWSSRPPPSLPPAASTPASMTAACPSHWRTAVVTRGGTRRTAASRRKRCDSGDGLAVAAAVAGRWLRRQCETARLLRSGSPLPAFRGSGNMSQQATAYGGPRWASARHSSLRWLGRRLQPSPRRLRARVDPISDLGPPVRRVARPQHKWRPVRGIMATRAHVLPARAAPRGGPEARRRRGPPRSSRF